MHLCSLKWPWSTMQTSIYSFWECPYVMNLVTDIDCFFYWMASTNPVTCACKSSLKLVNAYCQICQFNAWTWESNMSPGTRLLWLAWLKKGQFGSHVGPQWRGNLPRRPSKFETQNRVLPRCCYWQPFEHKYRDTRPQKRGPKAGPQTAIGIFFRSLGIFAC